MFLRTKHLTYSDNYAELAFYEYKPSLGLVTYKETTCIDFAYCFEPVK